MQISVVLLLILMFSRSFTRSYQPLRIFSLLRSSAQAFSLHLQAPQSIESTSSESQKFKRGQSITAKILQFGPLGASVEVNDGEGSGLIIQSEIAYFRQRRSGEDIVIGEVLEAFVEKVRDDGKINVSLRPTGLSRIEFVQKQVTKAIHVTSVYTSSNVTYRTPLCRYLMPWRAHLAE